MTAPAPDTGRHSHVRLIGESVEEEDLNRMIRLLAAFAFAALLLAGVPAAQAAPKAAGAYRADATEFGSRHRHRHYRRVVFAKDPAAYYWRRYRPPVPCSVYPEYPCDPQAYFGYYTRPYKYSPSYFASFRYYGPGTFWYPGASWW